MLFTIAVHCPISVFTIVSVGHVSGLAIWKIESAFELKLLVTTSAFPSPLRSPIAREMGPLPGIKSTLDVNEAALILPGVAVLRSTDILLEY